MQDGHRLCPAFAERDRADQLAGVDLAAGEPQRRGMQQGRVGFRSSSNQRSGRPPRSMFGRLGHVFAAGLAVLGWRRPSPWPCRKGLPLVLPPIRYFAVIGRYTRSGRIRRIGIDPSLAAAVLDVLYCPAPLGPVAPTPARDISPCGVAPPPAEPVPADRPAVLAPPCRLARQHQHRGETQRPTNAKPSWTILSLCRGPVTLCRNPPLPGEPLIESIPAERTDVGTTNPSAHWTGWTPAHSLTSV